MGETSSEVIDLRMDWRVADDFPIAFANEFMSQIGREEFVITFGQLMPRPW